MKKPAILLILFLSIIIYGYSATWGITGNPCMRSMTGMITVTFNNQIVLFGGESGRLPWGQCFNDLWTFDLTNETWKLVESAGPAPSPRYDISVTYHALDNRMILFGGSIGTALYNDVWEFNLNSGSYGWTQLVPSGALPSPRSSVAAVIDPVNNRLVIFGGCTSTGAVNETWSLDLNNLSWRQLSPTGTPPSPRYAISGVYDSVGHQMLVFGGINTSLFNETWALDLTEGSEHWVQLSPGGAIPAARCRHFWFFDEGNRDMYIGFGYNNLNSMTFFNDVYALHLPTLTWVQVQPTGPSIAPRRGSCAAYNPTTRKAYVFGGDYYGGYYFDDTFVLSMDSVVSIEETDDIYAPVKILIRPNPARASCQIRAIIPDPGECDLHVVDAVGRIVKTFFQARWTAGDNIIAWNLTDDHERRLPAGAYFILLEKNGNKSVKKTILIE